MNWFKKTYIVDINLLPSEYRNEEGKVSLKEIKQYEKDFKIKILPIDSSPRNTKGQNFNHLIFKRV